MGFNSGFKGLKEVGHNYVTEEFIINFD